jgi:hypothetical protein
MRLNSSASGPATFPSSLMVRASRPSPTAIFSGLCVVGTSYLLQTRSQMHESGAGNHKSMEINDYARFAVCDFPNE